MDKRKSSRFWLCFMQLQLWGIAILSFLSKRIDIYTMNPFAHDTIVASRIELAFKIWMILCYAASSYLLCKKNRIGIPAFSVAVCFPFGLFLEIDGIIRSGRVPLWQLYFIGIGVLYGAVRLCAPISKHTYRNRALQRRFHRFRSAIWSSVGGLLILIVITNIFAPVFQRNGSESKEVTMQSNENEYAEQFYHEEFEKFQEDRWNALNLKERTALLQLCSDAEADYYGIPQSIVTIDFLPRDTLGCYSPKEHVIYINRYCVENLPACITLTTLLHEQRHVFQHELVEAYQNLPAQYARLLPIREARIYEIEFQEYVNGSNSYKEYYTQQVEEDARTAAESRAAFYCKTYGIEFARIITEDYAL